MYHRLDPSQQLQVLVSFYASGWYIARVEELKRIGKGSNHLLPIFSALWSFLSMIFANITSHELWQYFLPQLQAHLPKTSHLENKFLCEFRKNNHYLVKEETYYK
jgi:hypothetical protein